MLKLTMPLVAVILTAACVQGPREEIPAPAGESDIATAVPRLNRTVIASGLDRPWGIAFLPGGDMVFTERTGRIGLVYAATGEVLKIADPPGDFVNEPFQAGMLGIAVDPAFDENRYVYTYFLSDAGTQAARSRTVGGAETTTGSTTLMSASARFGSGDMRRAVVGPGIAPGTFIRAVLDPSSVELSKPATTTQRDASIVVTTRDNRVVRWVMAANRRSLMRDADIVTGIPYGSEDEIGHNGGRIRFGPDGYLWITTGDGDVATNAQDGTSLGGKVLRVDRDGAAAPDNPQLAGFDRRIYTYGHRNPQGLTFQPSSGQAYAVEHGPNRDDEVNRLEPGGNYGWHPLPPPYTNSVPMTDMRLFPDAVAATWSSGLPTVAPSGATFLSGRQRGAWDGAMVLATLADSSRGRRLIVLFFNDAQQVTASTSIFNELDTRLRTVVQGPDGNLYVATDHPRPGGEIWRVQPF